MANYYKILQNYVNTNNLKGKKFTMNEFEQRMSILFGFGGRNRAFSRWMKNFARVNMIDVVVNNGVRYIVIL